MDKFLTQTHCDRCRGSLESGRTMSMFNEDCLCMKCKEKEQRRKDYKTACDADHKAIKRENYNFKGIGFKNEGNEI